MAPTIHISDYSPHDYESIVELWHQTGLGGEQRGDNQRIIEDSIALGGKFLVAKTTEGKVVGTSWMTFDGRRIHLHHCGVCPSYQRQGIGKKLVEHSLQFAHQKGYQIKLEVHRTNRGAIELYKRCGFGYLGDFDIYIIRDVGSLKF